MSRKQWLWLLIWLLIFFSLFCTWNKLPLFTKKSQVPLKNAEKNSTIKSSSVVEQNQSTSSKAKKINKQMNLTISKVKDNITLMGIVPNKQTKDEITDNFKDLFAQVDESGLIIDEDCNEDLFGIDLLENLAEDFSHFEDGTINYDGDRLEINGTTSNSVTMGSINAKIKLLQEKGVEALNNLKLETIKYSNSQDESNTVEKQDDNLSNTDENSSEEESDTIKLTQDRLKRLLEDKRIEFIFSKDRLTKKSKRVLDDVVDILKDNNSTLIEIGGHTDSSGNKQRNQKLSQRRANSVKRYLIKKGIAKDRLKAVGYGDSMPIVENNSIKNRQKNRRVEFKVLGEIK